MTRAAACVRRRASPAALATATPLLLLSLGGGRGSLPPAHERAAPEDGADHLTAGHLADAHVARDLRAVDDVADVRGGGLQRRERIRRGQPLRPGLPAEQERDREVPGHLVLRVLGAVPLGARALR